MIFYCFALIVPSGVAISLRMHRKQFVEDVSVSQENIGQEQETTEN